VIKEEEKVLEHQKHIGGCRNVGAINILTCKVEIHS